MSSPWWYVGVLAIGLAAGCWLTSGDVFGAPPEDRETLRRQVEEAFKLHSYQTAIAKGRQFLAGQPPAEQAAAVEKMVGISLLRVKQYDEGAKILDGLRQRSPAYQNDAEVLDAIARGTIEQGSDAPESLARANEALAQWSASGDKRRQVSLLFVLLDMLGNRIYNFPLEPGVQSSDYRDRPLNALAKILALYDRILALDPSSAEQVRALYGKSQLLRNNGYNLLDYPRDKWPAFIQTPYDLSKPIPTAIEFEREIVRRFPDSNDAPAALFRIGEMQQSNLNAYKDAIATYESIATRYPGFAHKAKSAIEEITRPQLSFQVAGVALPGAKPTYRWNARNIKEIALAAYPVNLFEVIRKVDQLNDVERYSLDGRKPAVEWTIATKDDGNHVPVNSNENVEAPLTENNAYVVVATGANPEGKRVKATILLVVSRLALMQKLDDTVLRCFSVDATTGKPLPNTQLLVQRFDEVRQVPILGIRRNVYSYQEAAVPDNGFLEISHPKKQKDDNNLQLTAIARCGNDYAIVGQQYYWGYYHHVNDALKSYSYTDRPVYRPGQSVQFKHILRRSQKGVYANVANEQLNVVINDSRGNQIYSQKLLSNADGSVSGSVELASNASLGIYSMLVSSADGTGANASEGANFRVEEYKKPEFEVTVKPEKPSCKIGEKLKVNVHGEYYFGGGVASADVHYTVKRREYRHSFRWPGPYDWLYEGAMEGIEMGPGMGRHFRGRHVPYWQPPREELVAQGDLKTDEFGNALIEFPANSFDATPGADVEFSVEVAMVDESRRSINGAASIKATHQSYYIGLHTQKHLYQPGDRIRVDIRSASPNGQPVAFDGKATIFFVEQRETNDETGKVKTEEKLEAISSPAAKADKAGRGVIEFVAERHGYYKIETTAPDPFGAQVKGSAYVWVAKGSGELAHYATGDLDIVVDQNTISAGDTLRALITSKHPEAYVLLTGEADRVYYSKVIYIPKNSATVEIPIAKNFRPSVTLNASLFRDSKIHNETKMIFVPPVEEFLTVTIKAPKEEFLPREEAEVEVTVVDHQGRPKAAEFSLGMFDASVLYIQDETRGDIRKFFYGNERQRSVLTETSYSFQFWAEGRRERAMAKNGRGVGYGGAMPAAAPMAAAESAAPGRRMAKADNLAADVNAKPAVEPEIRSEFPDTVYWNAHLKSDANGMAKTKVRFPDSLTTWRLTAIAVTPETTVGEVKHEVRTKKNVIVRLQAPRFFVETDEVWLSAIVHNYLDQPKSIRTEMNVTSELAFHGVAVDGILQPNREVQQKKFYDVEVPAGGERRVDFLAKVLRPGKVKILAKALTDVESDAMQMEYPILEYGARQLLAENGILFGGDNTERSMSVRLRIPDKVREGSQSLSIRVAPTVAGVMLESLPYLIDYPYGCTEQTTSRFVPAVLTLHTLRKLGINLADLKNMAPKDPVVAERLKRFMKSPVYDPVELDKIVKAGVARLSAFQNADGGWGWWKNDSSSPYLSSYVLTGFAMAADAGVAVPADVIERGVAFLTEIANRSQPILLYPWQQSEEPTIRVYVLYALAQAKRDRLAEPKIAERLRQSFEQRDELNDYARALLALTLHAAGKKEEADIVVANIVDRARVDEKTATASWGDATGYFYWYQSGTEATSFSLRALLAIRPNSPLIPQTVQWFMRHREGTRWFSTKDTALVCHALADYLQRTGELNPDLTITVDVDGQKTKTVRVTRENLFTFDDELKLTGADLGVGEKLATVRCTGRGNLYWSATAEFFNKEEHIPAKGNELYIDRQYQRLIPKEVEKTRTVWNAAEQKHVEEKYKAIDYDRKPIADGEELKSGDLIEVQLAIDARNNFEYLMFEDFKPAGCEATELKSGYSWGTGGHREFRDDRVAFFVSYLNQGKHTIQYRLRAEIPGVFHALPSQAECMYAPRVRGNAESWIIRVKD